MRFPMRPFVYCLILLQSSLHAADDRIVNVRSFKDRVKAGDWSPAIQAAIDSINKKNGYTAGGVVLIPAGTYRIDRSIVIGNKPAHWGLKLSGYGATLVGSKTLDKQKLIAPEKEEADKGVPILILKHPNAKGSEGASFCIEGLRFKREQRLKGIAISVPWKDVPKNVSFRNLKIHNQKIGIHIKFAWQFSFSDCLFRENDIGMMLQSHANNIGIVNCAFRRQHRHGLQIGPDRGQWASNGYHISGSIFESNKGYGILLRSAGQIKISGNYFEANGNGVGVNTPNGEVTIDTNLFYGIYGHGWQRNPFSDQAQIVLAGAKKVQLRNNHYARTTALFRRKRGGNLWEYVPRPKGPQGVPNDKVARAKRVAGYEYKVRSSGIFIAGRVSDGIVLDALPVVHHDALKSGLRAASHTGLSYYDYDPLTNTFSEKSLIQQSAADLAARQDRLRAGLAERMTLVKTQGARISLQLEVGHSWLAQSKFALARREYEKAYRMATPTQTHLRAAVTIEIAKSYMRERKYQDAVKTYQHALNIGPGGWRLGFAKKELARAKRLATKVKETANER